MVISCVICGCSQNIYVCSVGGLGGRGGYVGCGRLVMRCYMRSLLLRDARWVSRGLFVGRGFLQRRGDMWGGLG